MKIVLLISVFFCVQVQAEFNGQMRTILLSGGSGQTGMYYGPGHTPKQTSNRNAALNYLVEATGPIGMAAVGVYTIGKTLINWLSGGAEHTINNTQELCIANNNIGQSYVPGYDPSINVQNVSYQQPLTVQCYATSAIRVDKPQRIVPTPIPKVEPTKDDRVYIRAQLQERIV